MSDPVDLDQVMDIYRGLMEQKVNPQTNFYQSLLSAAFKVAN